MDLEIDMNAEPEIETETEIEIETETDYAVTSPPPLGLDCPQAGILALSLLGISGSLSPPS
jgi:hypothetical protein